MYIGSELINEIYYFLKELNNIKIAPEYQLKLYKLIEKLDIFFNKFDNQTPVIEEENVYEIPIKSPSDNTLKLPTKLGAEKLPPEITLTGLLYYRYEPQLWERYHYSYLYYHRLICEKNIPSYNVNNNCNVNSTNFSKNSGVCLFLIGYTAVETGKDSGMNYVFKLTHPTEETKVFATETEEECSKWVEQINFYANGIIPMEHRNFSRSSIQQVEFFTEPTDTGQFYDTTDKAINQNDIILEDSLVNSESSHLRRQSADIMNLISNSSIQTKASINLSDRKFNRSRSSYCTKNPIINQVQFPQPPNQSQTINSHNTSYNSNKLISSVRRKVESIGYKYRNRKSFAGFSNAQITTFNPIVQNNSFHNNITAPIQSGYCNTTNEIPTTQSAEQHKLRSKTMPQISPIDTVLVSSSNSSSLSNTIIANNISRKRSSGSNTCYNKIGFPQHKDALFSGVAKLRIQGNSKSGWIERWCQLKPQLLECYHIPSNTPTNMSNGSGSHGSPNNTAKLNSSSANNSLEEPILDFALCLEDLNLDISNDKKHRSALRLSCDSIKQDLLFEVLDKVVMGGWIKAFIEALGLNKKGLSRDSKQKESEKENIQKSDLIYVSHNSIGNDSKFESEGSSIILREHISHFKDPESLTESDLLLQHHKSPDIMQRSLTTIHSESIYDEVTTPDLRTAHVNKMRSRDNSFRNNVIQEQDDVYPANHTPSRPENPILKQPHTNDEVSHTPARPVEVGRAYNRRWSTPALLEFFIPPAAPSVVRRNTRDHPLPSLPASTPDSENNSDSVSDVTPIGTIHSQGSSTIENRIPTLKATSTLNNGESVDADVEPTRSRGISKDDLDLLVSKKHSIDQDLKACFLDDVHHPFNFNHLPTPNDSNEMMSTSLYTHPPDTDEDSANAYHHHYHTTDHRSANGHNQLSCRDKFQNGCSLADLIARFNDENDNSIGKLAENTVRSNGSHSNSHNKSASSTITNSTNTTDDSLVNTTCRNLHSSFFNTNVSSSSNRCSNSASVISVKSCDNKFPHNSISLTSSSSSSSNHCRPKLCRSTTSSSAHQYNRTQPNDKVPTVCKSFSADLSGFNESALIPPKICPEPPTITEPCFMQNTSIAAPNFPYHYNSYQATPSVPLRTNDDKRVKERPKSLLVKKNSTDMIFEEISSVKEEIKNLKKRKKHLKRNKTKLTNKNSIAINGTSNDPSVLSDIINSIDNQLNFKENRLKELSNHSKKQRCLADVSSKIK